MKPTLIEKVRSHDRPPGRAAKAGLSHRAMSLLLAEDLLLLCWDEDKGKPRPQCAGDPLMLAVGSALVLELLLQEALLLVDERVRATGIEPNDLLLATALEQIDRKRQWRPPKLEKVVREMGTPTQVKAVRDRLVQRGVLRPERRKVFGVFPRWVYPLAERLVRRPCARRSSGS